jgi:hypothetical protein
VAVDQFEVFHGVVLTRLVRADRPITVRLIETRPAEAWAAYTLNGAVDLFVKHSAAPRMTSQGRSWTFVVGPGQLRQMMESRSVRQMYVALVGGSGQVKDSRQWSVCLLEPDEIESLLDFVVLSQQAFVVKASPGKWLRVYKERVEVLRVPQNRVDTWRLPGG